MSLPFGVSYTKNKAMFGAGVLALNRGYAKRSLCLLLMLSPNRIMNLEEEKCLRISELLKQLT